MMSAGVGGGGGMRRSGVEDTACRCANAVTPVSVGCEGGEGMVPPLACSGDLWAAALLDKHSSAGMKG